MEEVPDEMTGPRSIGLPEAPDPDPLAKGQWHVLMAVMDTVIPSCQGNQVRDADVTALGDAEHKKAIARPTFNAFLAEKPSEIPLFQDILKQVLAGFPDDKLATLRSVLSLIE